MIREDMSEPREADEKLDTVGGFFVLMVLFLAACFCTYLAKNFLQR